jgi:hypothetical protein
MSYQMSGETRLIEKGPSQVCAAWIDPQAYSRVAPSSRFEPSGWY